jgi:hypothetical protein
MPRAENDHAETADDPLLGLPAAAAAARVRGERVWQRSEPALNIREEAGRAIEVEVEDHQPGRFPARREYPWLVPPRPLVSGASNRSQRIERASLVGLSMGGGVAERPSIRNGTL